MLARKHLVKRKQIVKPLTLINDYIVTAKSSGYTVAPTFSSDSKLCLEKIIVTISYFMVKWNKCLFDRVRDIFGKQKGPN